MGVAGFSRNPWKTRRQDLSFKQGRVQKSPMTNTTWWGKDNESKTGLSTVGNDGCFICCQDASPPYYLAKSSFIMLRLGPEHVQMFGDFFRIKTCLSILQLLDVVLNDAHINSGRNKSAGIKLNARTVFPILGLTCQTGKYSQVADGWLEKKILFNPLPCALSVGVFLLMTPSDFLTA